MHLLYVLAHGCLLRLVAGCHLHKLAIHLSVATLIGKPFPSHHLYFLSGAFAQLGMEFLAFFGVDGFVFELYFWVGIDGDALECLPT